MKVYVLLAFWAVSMPVCATEPGIFFQERIRPILVKNCFPCHTTSRLGGLQLDSRERIISGGKSGPAITPGDPEHSLLVRAILYESELKMPPQAKLKESEIGDIIAWVKAGAIWSVAPAVASREEGRTTELAEFFEMRVRPILAKNCYACHTQSRMGGLQLDTREHAFAGGKDGAVIVPGDPARSLLFRAITHNEDRKMPPQEKLKPADIAAIDQWIRSGAVWTEDRAVGGNDAVITADKRAFWSFQPVRKPPLPRVKDRQWPKQPLDYFILAALEQKGLAPVAPADKRTLIRRVTLDLVGLPPAPEDVDAFLKDDSPDAFARVVDRLLASPHYGERWGRHWLDIARYSDDQLWSSHQLPYPQAYRYRDWVIQAFNKDLPYDKFIKAQLAGDQMPCDERENCIAGLGLYALSPSFEGFEDRVDVTARGFLGLTVACAQCHDHKFDPIPTKDYYSLLGVFTSTRLDEYPLVAPDIAKSYSEQSAKINQLEAQIKQFVDAQSALIGQALASKTADYLMATRGGPTTGLDPETLERWKRFLLDPVKAYPFLKQWYATSSREAASEFQDRVIALLREKKTVDDKNFIILGFPPDPKKTKDAVLNSLGRDSFRLWYDLFNDGKYTQSQDRLPQTEGVLHYGEKDVGRFLTPLVRAYLDEQRAALAKSRQALPPKYPFLQVIRDIDQPRDERIRIRGSSDNLGAVAPRAFLQILSNGTPKAFTKGSGRLELAEAIADPSNPLTARVMVNRIWQHHFGQGIVRTPSNFGQLGERPSHPELLDYLATRFVEVGWSIKKLHREIVLSSTYSLSAEHSEKNFAVDSGNQLLWRANRRRMDVEALRDSLLSVGGDLDLTPGGPPEGLTYAKELAAIGPKGRVNFVTNDRDRRRTVYSFMSRRKLDGVLALFDFPSPNTTSEQRLETNVPQQRLFFLNSELIYREANGLARRLKGKSEPERIQEAYLILYSRPATNTEIGLGLEFFRKGGTWEQYAQALLSANDFLFID